MWYKNELKKAYQRTLTLTREKQKALKMNALLFNDDRC